MSTDEEMPFSDNEVNSDDEGDVSSQISDEGNDSNQGLSDESEIEDDESNVDNVEQELINGTKYYYNNE